MKTYKMFEMRGGWFIGDFEPSVFKTKDFEVAFLKHHKGQKWPSHYHAIAKEINYLVKGKMKIQNKILVQGDIFIFEPKEIANPEFLEDCEVLVVKIPSVIGDKYEAI